MPYRHDPDTRALVADLLYRHLPELYRTHDMPHPLSAGPTGTPLAGQLARFLEVLGVPLAIVRQNVEELHADLFIDTSAEWVIAYLADMVGTTLVFPDGPANRRDVRGTVGWRRRKGTPSTLEEMATELSGELVVTHEGWQRLLIAQDLNLLREERTLPDLRPAIIAETVTGPLDREYHVADPRQPISDRHGRYHPRHVVHWRHPTYLYPLSEGTARNLTQATDPDLRFAVHPLGRDYGMRLSRSDISEDIDTDLVLPMHFDETPGDYFGHRGGFTVSICGLDAAVPTPSDEPRVGDRTPADAAILAGTATLSLIDRDAHGQTGPVEVALCAVPRQGGNPLLPDVAGAVVRGRVELDAAGATSIGGAAAAVASPIAMLRVRAAPPATAAWFPGATLEIVSSRPAGRLASTDAGLAVEGFLRGAPLVEIPAMWLRGDHWLYLAADGSVHLAQSSPPGAADIPLVDTSGTERLPGEAATPGPGAAWPPTATSAEAGQFTRIPAAPGRGPAVLHGGPVLTASLNPVGAGLQSVLTWAVRRINAGIVEYEPFLQLAWVGPDPTTATNWRALRSNGTQLGPAGLAARFREIADIREEGGDFQLVVRFESQSTSATLAPCEVAFTGDDGRVVLIHLPAMTTQPGGPEPNWPTPFNGASAGAVVAEDGSTQVDGSTQTARYAHGDYAPLREYATLRRRRIRYRSLCSWHNETAVLKTPAAPAGWLDVDPEFGLFAMAPAEPPQVWPPPPGPGLRPASVTVDYQMGYTDHVGALPAPREPELDVRLATPTRLVTRDGAFSSGADAESHSIPRYRSLTAAFAAVAADAAAGTGAADEVVQFEDGATYQEQPQWPAGPTTLTVQAAERTRPTLELSGWTDPALVRYESLIVRGLAFGGSDVHFPLADDVAVQFCTVTDSTSRLIFRAPADASAVAIQNCVTAGLAATGAVDLKISDSVVDAGAIAAITSDDGMCRMDRVTVVGSVAVMALDASEVVFGEAVDVLDRFSGCVRYSRVPHGATLPRKHRVAVGAKVVFVSVDRDHPAHARLSERTDASVRRGAEDGSEMGAFHDRRFAQHGEALAKRLAEFTPAGLDTGIVIRQ